MSLLQAGWPLLALVITQGRGIALHGTTSVGEKMAWKRWQARAEGLMWVVLVRSNSAEDTGVTPRYTRVSKRGNKPNLFRSADPVALGEQRSFSGVGTGLIFFLFPFSFCSVSL